MGTDLLLLSYQHWMSQQQGWEKTSEKTKMRQPGIEPGPLPWKGRILTIRPLTRVKGMTLCTYHDTS